VEAADKKQLDLDLINAADVIFCTLSVAGRHILRTCKRVRTLIVDEAACACEAEVLVSLSAGPRRALMVGDPSPILSLSAFFFFYCLSLSH
jgi:superfamily I DNA and/or RNA helicase